MNRRITRLLALLLTTAMILGTFPWAQASHISGTSLGWEQEDIDLMSPHRALEVEQLPTEQPLHEDTESVRVSIILEDEAPIERFSFDQMSTEDLLASIHSYRDRLDMEQETVADRISNEVLGGLELDVVQNLNLVMNVISANVLYGDIEKIRDVDGVKDVVLETVYYPAVYSKGGTFDPNMAISTETTGAQAMWTSGYTGAGRRVAVIDTGLDIQHQSFDNGAFKHALTELAAKEGKTLDQYMAEKDLLTAQKVQELMPQLHAGKLISTAQYSGVYRTDKIPFAVNYVDKSLRADHTDTSGQNSEHGSHVSGTVCANRFIPKVGGGYANAAETVHVVGNAPDAQLIVMKVFGNNGGAYDSDYMAAVEDAIVLGCDAVNLSLGSSVPGTTTNAKYQDVLNDLVTKDMLMVVSAGNSGYWAQRDATAAHLPYADEVQFQTAGSPGTFANPLTVASCDNNGIISSMPIKMLDKAGTAPLEHPIVYQDGSSANNKPFVTLDTSADKTGTEYPFVFIDGLGKPEDYQAGDKTLNVNGAIVLCSRGEINFAAKADTAVKNGAAATLVYNNEDGVFGMNLQGYTSDKPSASISKADAEFIKQNAEKKTLTSADGAKTLTYYTGKLKIFGGQAVNAGDGKTKMSIFSSWGAPGDLSMKPEITAPGGNIYSVEGLHGTQGGYDAYELMSGTSMAAPQVTGITALVRQAIDEQPEKYDVSPLTKRALTQSLLMSTASPIRDSSGTCVPILQQGSGLINADAAVKAASYILVDGQPDGKVKAELGDDPQKAGLYTFTFTINDLVGGNIEYVLSAEMFTQGSKIVDGVEYLDTMTTALPADVRYSVSGAEVKPIADPSLLKYDYSGDGRVDRTDAQLLMDHIIRNEPLMYNAQNTDVSGDGTTNTFDVHALLTLVNSAVITVPTKGKTTVTVTIELADKTTNRYVEGFIFAKPKTTAEGVEYSTHSIPVLAYCGSWTDYTMYDVGSYIEYAYGTETRTPHVAGGGERMKDNALVIRDDASGDSFYFGGNPYYMEPDGYHPERNAMNSQNSTITGVMFRNTRNAAASRVTIQDKNGALYHDIDGGSHYAAFGSEIEKDGQWASAAPKSIALNWKGTDANGSPLLENTSVDIKLALAPEMYVKGDKVDWSALGEGACMTYPVTIDNTAPKLVGAEVSGGKLRLTVEDNQYIAAVELYSSDGVTLLGTQIPDQTAAGQTLTVEFDADKLVGEFKVGLADYAQNQAVFTVGGDKPIVIPPHIEGGTPYYHFYASSDKGIRQDIWYGVDKDHQQAAVLGNGHTDPNMRYTAGDYVGGHVFAFQGDMFGRKTLRVMAENALSSTELVNYYPTFSNQPTQDEVFYASDMAYNVADGKMYFLWYTDTNKNAVPHFSQVDLLNGDIMDLGEMRQDIALMTCDHGGNFYGITGTGSNKTLYTWTSATWKDPTQVAAVQYPAEMQGMAVSASGSLAWDANKGKLVQVFSIVGAGGNHLGMVEIDRTTGAASNFWENTELILGLPSALYITNAPSLYDFNNDQVTSELDVEVLRQSIQTIAADPRMDLNFDGQVTEEDAKCLTNYIKNVIGDPFDPAAQSPSVDVVPKNVTMVVGGSETLQSRITPWCVDAKSTWSADPTGIVNVSPDGVVTGMAPGSCQVTATVTTADGKMASSSCRVDVKSIDTAFDALIWDTEGQVWWSNFRANDIGPTGEIQYVTNRQTATRLSNAFKTPDGKMYAVDYDPNTQASSLYTIDPAMKAETKINNISISTQSGPSPVGAMDICYAPHLGPDGGGCALAVFGPYIYRLDLATGQVNGLVQFTEKTNLIGIAYTDTFDGQSSGRNDRFLVIAQDGSVYLASISLDGKGQLSSNTAADINRVANTQILSSHEFNDACYAKASDGTPYLYWAQFNQDNNVVDLMALSVDLDAKTSVVFDLGTFPQGVWPVGGLIPTDPTQAVLGDNTSSIMADPWAQNIAPGFSMPGFPMPGYPMPGFPVEGYPMPGYPIQQPDVPVIEQPVQQPDAPVTEQPIEQPDAPVTEQPIEQPDVPVVEQPPYVLMFPELHLIQSPIFTMPDMGQQPGHPQGASWHEYRTYPVSIAQDMQDPQTTAEAPASLPAEETVYTEPTQQVRHLPRAAQLPQVMFGSGGTTGVKVKNISFNNYTHVITVEVAVDKAMPSGRFTAKYDTNKMEFLDAIGSADVVSYADANGSVDVGFASAHPIDDGETVASLRFRYYNSYIVATLSLTTTENGDANVDVKEDTELTAPADPSPIVPPAPDHGGKPDPKPVDPTIPGYGGFVDLNGGAWYRDAISYVIENGLMTGTSPNTFSPNDPLSRAMLVTILHRAEKEPSAAVQPFDDVQSGKWYSNAVYWANSAGIVNGYGNGKFGPNDHITREQLAAILYRYASYKGLDTSTAGHAMPDFRDNDEISDWAGNAISWCVKVGILNGKDGNRLDPKGKASRAETAAMIMRFMSLAPQNDLK